MLLDEVLRILIDAIVEIIADAVRVQFGAFYDLIDAIHNLPW